MRRLVCLTLAALFIAVPVALAAGAPATDNATTKNAAADPANVTTASGGDKWVSKDPADSKFKEDLPAFPFLYAAYALIWAGLFLYIVSLGRRQRKLDAQIAELREIVRNKSAGA